MSEPGAGGGVEGRGGEGATCFPSTEATDRVGQGTRGPGAALVTEACHVSKSTTVDAGEAMHASEEE